MKHLLYSILALLALTVLAPQLNAAEEKPTYRHDDCFKFKEGTTPEKIAEIEKAFAALPKKIDTVTDFEWGTNVSPEDHAQGFTHCFIVSFADKAGLEKYIPHDAHKAFVALLLPSLDKVFVIDFVAK
jgi:hypothetical protein